MRQSWPDFGLGFQAEFLESFEVIPSSIGSGYAFGTGLRVGTRCLSTLLRANMAHVVRVNGTCKTVEARFWPWLSGEVAYNL